MCFAGFIFVFQKARAAPDPLVKKRKEDNESELSNKKVDNRSQEERLKSSTIPLWNVPYDEQVNKKIVNSIALIVVILIQLKIKEANMKKVLKRLAISLKQNNADLQKWLDVQKAANDDLPCLLETLRFSGEIEG